ncbi:hypothetical protein TPHA_0C04940 [Tetrapisispora phaffii CBS 4417]|uniref:Prefoldin subunit 5 n=1 Tax=Tetrapisispora phaffii (strain ATCC 24235 / CBS 4417 / NBRC 1672 / NRRL Y-8282 / UCD 70-5) TaxID=1071381 RepID=G8BQY0_TETPH|nr:hypothetical protein TPHA_0C04940 [Tetrapisispora phaffii CBS 4417]CCE62642.1 hypothetical protein TPHA_0C04940 [Tetrapisispora phaffii CBS 4417]
MSSQKIDLSKLNAEQLAAVKQQFDQELQHFTQSLQALNVAKNKFTECIEDIKVTSSTDNENQKLLIPATASLYVPGKIIDNKKFLVDIGTGYYVEKDADKAIEFYQKKINKLSTESTQIQNIIKEKSQSSFAIEQQIREAAIRQNHEAAKEQPAQNEA